MSISTVSLCLVFLTFLTSSLVLCSPSPKVELAASASASTEEAPKRHIDPPAMLVSESTEVDSSSSSMAKIDDEPARNSAVAGFFRYGFPFYGWPFPMVKPVTPSVPATPVTGAEEEESEKVPSSPSEGNRDGGNA